MIYPFLVDVNTFYWMIPFALIFLPMFLSIFIGIATFLSGIIASKGSERILSLAVCWVMMEWLRGNILTGFPWNLAGYIWSDIVTVSQLASIFGIYGLSLITVIVCSMPAQLAQKSKNRWLLPIIIVASFILVHIWGVNRIDIDINRKNAQTIRLVQPNIPQKEKWKKDLAINNLIKHVDLSTKIGFEKIKAVIWPETASTFLLGTDKFVDQLISNAIPPNGNLITGVPRFISKNNETNLYNSLVVYNKEMSLIEFYDKHHLVPFGEFIPFRSFLANIGLSKITAGSLDYSPGNGPKTIKVDGLPSFSPLICFEVIFPSKIVNKFNRPEWLLSISNDGWFGPNAGPRQHFDMARIRSIEEGIPLIRVSNMGISASIDPFGRIIEIINIGNTGYLDVLIPKSLSKTVYSRYGDLVLFTICLIILLFVLRGRFFLFKG